MLIAVILTVVWVAVMVLVVATCRMAARSDRMLRASSRSERPWEQWEKELLAPVERRPKAPRHGTCRKPIAGDAQLQPAAREYVGDRAQQDPDVGP